MFQKPHQTVRLFSFQDDQIHVERGSLIPGRTTQVEYVRFSPQSASVGGGRVWVQRVRLVAVATVSVFALLLVGTTGYGVVATANLASAPAVTIVDPYTDQVSSLEYGPEAALSKHTMFTETRNVFIEEGLTFIEVDLSRSQLRFFKNGVLLQSAEVLAVGEPGSWWDTPSGLYKIEAKDESVFTTIGQANLPWQLKFQSNFIIHGWPTYPDGTEVPAEFSGGGIRLSDESAQALYRNVLVGTPILVHAAPDMTPDTFVYEPIVPELTAEHYFIADIDNGTILAASDLDEAVPIASLTKLMTAVVAAEKLDLDSRVRVTSPTFVMSLIPRLAERSSVSMYSLLQLLLVESSNEAAETIAGEYGRDQFMAAMNTKARQIGMLQSAFADPSGLSPNNISSVGDLYLLTKYINDNRKFIFEITRDAALPNAQIGGEFDGLVNFNEIESIDSFVGGKVGETIAAGQTSISLHQIEFKGEPRTLVVILLGSEGRTADIETLLAYVEQRFGR